MDLYLHTVSIIKLTHCSHDSECEYGKCHSNYIAFIPLKAIMAECKGLQSSHIKGADVTCLENNDESFNSSFKNAVLLVNTSQNPITESLHH